MEYILHRLLRLQQIFKSLEVFDFFTTTKQKIVLFFDHVRAIGYTPSLDDLEKRKLGIFNQLNFFQVITGLVVPVFGLINAEKFPPLAWLISSLPAMISMTVLYLNSTYKHNAALLTYFIFYPVFTCIIYINGIDLGIELSFILYGILSVFFLQDIGYMLFAVSLSMISYFVLAGAWKSYPFELRTTNLPAFVINQLLAIVYIFYGLYLIKRENTDYQYSILYKSRQLHKKNLEIEKQGKEIAHKAMLLEKQAAQLEEINAVKNKLFSIISHDLKAPMYALRNLFRNAQEFNMPGKELKQMIPEILNDLNYTTGLMENLLQWAKCQMQANTVRPQKIDISELTNEVVHVLHLQSAAKKIKIECKTGLPAYAYADRDMTNLVLRNLISNAIKFTPEKGKIIIGTNESSGCVEVFIQDSGTGIKQEDMTKINRNTFHTTQGTNSEAGTGLGLMLCKEFLAKNNGYLMIESEPGKGSTFSFTLPLAK